MANSLRFYPKLILRTPLFSTAEGAAPLDIKKLSQNAAFCEALYLGSPSLFRQFEQYAKSTEKDEKLENAIRKYMRRMSFRCTPFGLFASCSVINWGSESKNLITDLDKSWKRRTRFDMHFLCELIQYLNKLPTLRAHSIFTVNNTLYKSLDKYRYVEYFIKDGARSHQITAVTSQPYLDMVLDTARNGATINELSLALESEDVTLDEARVFVNSIIDAQILVSELDPNVTGEPLLNRIQQFVAKNNSPEIAEVIRFIDKISSTLNKLDENGTNSILEYSKLSEEVKKIGIEFEESKLLQTDLFRNLKDATLNHAIQKNLKDAIDVLLKFNGSKAENAIAAFKSKFFERYEYAEVPLATVLDPDRGLGYSASANYSVMPLVDDIDEKGDQVASSINWSTSHTLLSKIRQDAIFQKKRVVDLSDYLEEINKLPQNGNPFSAAFYAIFSVPYLSDGKPVIQMEGVGGVSGVPLIGRFADGNSAIGEVVKDLAEYEQSYFKNEDAILAEIAHLPEARTGNILFRPSFRKYEIPYLAKSLLPANQQLDIEDLMLSFNNNELVLRSKKLNKRIYPRLGNAHNYSWNSLPIYHFLSDLQYQGLRGSLAIRWGELDSTNVFTPRLIYKNIILDRAHWNFNEDSIIKFRANPEIEIERWKREYNLPDLVTLAEGDNELYLDLSEDASIELLKQESKGNTSITLKEFLFEHKDALVRSHNGHAQTNEFIAFILNETPRNKSKVDFPKNASASLVKRKFTVGDEWMFFKIYCGSKTADRIVSEYIYPLAAELIKRNSIVKWFFIRYADPETHIRVRFLVSEKDAIGSVIHQINEALSDLIEKGAISKLVMDTYVRELERYGSATIEESETLFYHDSNCTGQFLGLIEGDLGEKYRWQFALLSIESFLENFGLDLDQKVALLQHSKKSFESEFNVDKNIRKQINSKYGSHRKEIADLLNRNESNIVETFEPIFKLLEIRSFASEDVVQDIRDCYRGEDAQTFFSELLWSYVHMICNRIFIDKPRKHELLIYDFLFKYYMAEKMMKKAKMSIKEPVLVS